MQSGINVNIKPFEAGQTAIYYKDGYSCLFRIEACYTIKGEWFALCRHDAGLVLELPCMFMIAKKYKKGTWLQSVIRGGKA